MEFSLKTGALEKQTSPCLIVGVFEGGKLSESAKILDEASKGHLSALIQQGDISGKLGQTLMLHKAPHITADRILVVGCGPERGFNEAAYRDCCRKAVSAIQQITLKEALFCLNLVAINDHKKDHENDRELDWKLQQAAFILQDCLYRFDEFKSKKEKSALKRIVFWVNSRRELRSAEKAVLRGQAIGEAVSFGKDLANMPANICTPSFLAKTAQNLHKQYPKLNVAVLDEKEIQALKMGAFLSVAQGSKHPPRLITLEYRGLSPKQKPICLIGKGITFDTGGNSLKAPASMIGMKYDMCGAATVLAALKAVAELELPVNVIGIIPSAENMPGNTATRPEDIVTTMSGLTVEILNTDAEGRLILADAITYAERFDPEVVIDIATLTNACKQALGPHAAGLLSNHQPLADALMQAGFESGDRCWQLPLWEDYQEAMNSNFADVSNLSNMAEAGAITAACFLWRFVKQQPWAHLDIAGVASRGGKDRGATGKPIPLIIQYLIDRSQ